MLETAAKHFFSKKSSRLLFGGALIWAVTVGLLVPGGFGYAFFGSVVGAILAIPVMMALFTIGGALVMVYAATIGIFALSSLALYFALSLTQEISIINAHIVEFGWTFTRDLANLFFILIFIVIALATILRLPQYQWQKQLGTLVIIVLLINFSRVFVGFAVDVTNLFTNLFLGPVLSIGNFMGYIAQPYNSILDTLIDTFKSSGILKGISSILPAFMSFVLQVVLQIVINIIMSIVFLLYAVLFLVRIVVLWILTILLPLALVARILPQTQGYWKQWTKEFTQWILVGVLASFFIYLGFSLFSLMPDATKKTISDGFASTSGFALFSGPFESIMLLMLQSLMVAIFLIYGFVQSVKGAPAGGSGILKLTNQVGQFAKRTAGAAVMQRMRPGIARTMQAGAGGVRGFSNLLAKPGEFAGTAGGRLMRRGGRAGGVQGRAMQAAGGVLKVTGKGLAPLGMARIGGRAAGEFLEKGALAQRAKEQERKIRRIEDLAKQLRARKEQIESRLDLSQEQKTNELRALAGSFAKDTRSSVSKEEKTARIAALDKMGLTKHAADGIGERADNLPSWTGVSDTELAKELTKIDKKLYEEFLVRRIHKLSDIISKAPGEADIEYRDRLQTELQRLGMSKNLTPEAFKEIPKETHNDPTFVKMIAPYMRLDLLETLAPDQRKGHIEYWNSVFAKGELAKDPRRGAEEAYATNPNFVNSLIASPLDFGIRVPDEVQKLRREDYKVFRNSAINEWTRKTLGDSGVDGNAIRQQLEQIVQNTRPGKPLKDIDLNKLVDTETQMLQRFLEQQAQQTRAFQSLNAAGQQDFLKRFALSHEQIRVLVTTLARNNWNVPGPKGGGGGGTSSPTGPGSASSPSGPPPSGGPSGGQPLPEGWQERPSGLATPPPRTK